MSPTTSAPGSRPRSPPWNARSSALDRPFVVEQPAALRELVRAPARRPDEQAADG